MAASAAPSTPSGEFSVLGDFEEDRKPNIEYLDSLNEHHKRSRSAEDEGETERKLARVGGVGVGGIGAGLDVWGGGPGGQGPAEDGEHAVNVNGVEGSGMDADVGAVAVAEDDPIVYGPSFLSSFLPHVLCVCAYRAFISQWMANQCRTPKSEKNTTT